MKILFALFAILNAQATEIQMVELKGSINPGSASYILENLEKANKDAASAFIIQLNTPGGLLSSTREIIQSFSHSRVPVIVFVSPGGASATSAGALIALSAHLAVMSPGTNIGAAHPVGSSGEDVKGNMGEKVTNDTAALARAQATLRGRNPGIAEEIVTKSKSFSTEEALKNGIVNFVANDLNDLVRQLPNHKIKINQAVIEFPAGLNSKNIQLKEMNLQQKFVHFISDPNISTLLIALGGLALYAEISSGFSVIAPGVFGVFCLVLGFISLQTLPINIGGAILFVLGFGLLIAEAFITSYGMLTLAALVSIFLGGLFLIDSSAGAMRVSFSILFPLLGGIGFVCALIAYLLARDRLANQAQSGDPVIGKHGTVSTLLEDKKSGTVLVSGELWNFESQVPVSVGDEIIVKSLQGMKLKIERKN